MTNESLIEKLRTKIDIAGNYREVEVVPFDFVVESIRQHQAEQGTLQSIVPGFTITEQVRAAGPELVDRVARQYYELAPFADGKSYDSLTEDFKNQTYRPAARKLIAAMEGVEPKGGETFSSANASLKVSNSTGLEMGDAAIRKDAVTGNVGFGSSPTSDAPSEMRLVYENRLKQAVEVAIALSANGALEPVETVMRVILPYFRVLKPVSVSLEKCETAARKAHWNNGSPQTIDTIVKAVLDAAGVKYVE